MYLLFKIVSDLDAEDVLEGMSEKVEMALHQSDSRFLQTELRLVTNFDPTVRKGEDD